MIGFWTYFDNKRLFRYLNRYKEAKRLQKPFADVIRKAALSSRSFITKALSIGPAGV